MKRNTPVNRFWDSILLKGLIGGNLVRTWLKENYLNWSVISGTLSWYFHYNWPCHREISKEGVSSKEKPYDVILRLSTYHNRTHRSHLNNLLWSHTSDSTHNSRCHQHTCAVSSHNGVSLEKRRRKIDAWNEIWLIGKVYKQD